MPQNAVTTLLVTWIITRYNELFAELAAESPLNKQAGGSLSVEEFAEAFRNAAIMPATTDLTAEKKASELSRLLPCEAELFSAAEKASYLRSLIMSVLPQEKRTPFLLSITEECRQIEDSFDLLSYELGPSWRTEVI